MFDFDATKLLIFGIIALVAIPSKDLPRVLRQSGQLIGRMRRMAADFQGQLMDAVNQAEVEDLKKELAQINEASRAEIKSITDTAKDQSGYNDIHAATSDVSNAVADLDSVDLTVNPPLADPLPLMPHPVHPVESAALEASSSAHEQTFVHKAHELTEINPSVEVAQDDHVPSASTQLDAGVREHLSKSEVAHD